QGDRQAIEIVEGSPHGHAPREITVDDRLDGTRDGIDPGQESLAEQGAAADAEQDHDADRPGKGGDDRFLDRMDAMEIVTDAQQQAAAEIRDQGPYSFGAATILRGLRRGQGDPAGGGNGGYRRHFTGKMPAGIVLHQIIERARPPATQAYEREQAIKATALIFIPQEG